MRVGLALLAALFLFMLVWQSEWWAETVNRRGEYRSTNCYMPSEDVAGLTFRSKDDHRRSISFSKSGRFSIVYLGSGAEVAVDWSHILLVHIERDLQDPAYVSLSVQFDGYPEIRPSLCLFGLAQGSCVDKLEQR